MTLRAMKVATPPPTAPNAGRPKVPGTTSRSTARFTTLAIHMITRGGTGRPSPSSQEADATDSMNTGIDRAKTISGRLAPSARSLESPMTCSSGGPPSTSTTVEAHPIHNE